MTVLPLDVEKPRVPGRLLNIFEFEQCPHCLEFGDADCNVCDGHGTHSCWEDRCDNEHECGACDGTGKLEGGCPFCDGTQNVIDRCFVYVVKKPLPPELDAPPGRFHVEYGCGGRGFSLIDGQLVACTRRNCRALWLHR